MLEEATAVRAVSPPSEHSLRHLTHLTQCIGGGVISPRQIRSEQGGKEGDEE